MSGIRSTEAGVIRITENSSQRILESVAYAVLTGSQVVPAVGAAISSVVTRAFPVGVRCDSFVGGALVWGVVPDSHNADWQPIASTATSWSPVTDGQSAVWGAIPTPPNSWSPVSDDQSATWTNVG